MKAEQDTQRIHRLPETPRLEPWIPPEPLEIDGHRPGIMIGQAPTAVSGNKRLDMPPVPGHGAFRYAGFRQ